MPTAPPRLCSLCHRTGCDCQAKRRKRADERRGTSTERGYDAAWQSYRKAYIQTVVADDPFCQDCHKPFGRTSEIELHHVKKVAEHPELKLEWGNIRHICHECHAIRTRRGE